MQGLVEVWAEWSIHVDCVLLFLASRVAETASEGAGGLEGTVKAAARWHAGEEKEEEGKRRERRRRKERGRKLERGAGEEERTEGDREDVGGSVHVLSIYLLFISLQHDFEAALAAKDAIIEQLRRDLREMQAKLDVSGRREVSRV